MGLGQSAVVVGQGVDVVVADPVLSGLDWSLLAVQPLGSPTASAGREQAADKADEHQRPPCRPVTLALTTAAACQSWLALTEARPQAGLDRCLSPDRCRVVTAGPASHRPKPPARPFKLQGS